MARSDVELVGIGLEGVHGFHREYLSLERFPLLIAGPNNSGKSALLRALHWAVNEADQELIHGRRALTSRELEFLRPAFPATGLARRLSLWVRLLDGRSLKRFPNREGIAVLRMHFAKDEFYVACSRVTRKSKHENEDRALDLLGRIRDEYEISYVPVGRDVTSGELERLIDGLVDRQLRAILVYDGGGGSRKPYRVARTAVSNLDPYISAALGRAWSEILDDNLVRELTRSSKLEISFRPEDLLEGIKAAVRMRLVSGASDVYGVGADQVGSGLQSALVLAASRPNYSRMVRAKGVSPAKRILLVEEPETYLHPAAQRSFARALIASSSTIIATTHSHLIAAEVPHANVVHVRNHSLNLAEDADPDLAAKNEWLKRASASEALFYDSILLVEGRGDAAFFEAMRRRIASRPNGWPANRACVVGVGGKRNFGPWIRLLQSFLRAIPNVAERRISNERAQFVNWMIVADGADAIPDVFRALKESGISTSVQARKLAAHHSSTAGLPDQLLDVYALNAELADLNCRARFLEIDLEYAMIRDAKPATLARIVEAGNIDVTTLPTILTKLGSKAEKRPDLSFVAGKSPSGGRKEDWLRAAIAELLPRTAISGEVRSVMIDWLSPLFDGSSTSVGAILDGVTGP